MKPIPITPRDAEFIAMRRELPATIQWLASRTAPWSRVNHMWNRERRGDGLYVCEGHHERSSGCQWRPATVNEHMFLIMMGWLTPKP